MPLLSVKDFACIKTAHMQLTPVTLLIGPQASGKSVLTKLFYFFGDVLKYQYACAERGETLKQFQKSIVKRFCEWFPPSAWGKDHFEIRYLSGEIEYVIRSKSVGRSSPDEADFSCSEYFSYQYNSLLKAYKSTSKSYDKDEDSSFKSMEYEWRLRSRSELNLKKHLGADFIQSQFFIPAGRSFYTNLGKAFAMLEFGSQLDEATKRFGRYFTSLLDDSRLVYFGEKLGKDGKEFLDHQNRLIEKIFGGKLILKSNDRYLETNDGRRVPLSTLSSGQQEMLPLLLILKDFAKRLAYKGESGTSLLFIEEPEAHLFPSTQGDIIEHLVSISNFSAGDGRFLITTHSPYVLAKVNNLILAQKISVRNGGANSSKVEKLVPFSSQIAPAAVSAYALRGSELVSIKDETGLIDGNYLDSISDDISSVFMSLLELSDDD